MLVELRCRDWLDNIPHFSGAWNSRGRTWVQTGATDVGNETGPQAELEKPEEKWRVGRNKWAWKPRLSHQLYYMPKSTAALVRSAAFVTTNSHRLGCSAAVCWWQWCGFVENWRASLSVDCREVFVAQKVGAKLLSTADEPGAGAKCSMSHMDR